MTGLSDLDQGIGLDIVPSASLTNRRAFAPSHGSEADFEPSLDVAYKLTPAMNALLTINTDFSATEVDDRQVNLTRFNLFFPEKRDFFLREADIFEFGRIGASDGNGAVSNAERQNGRPFFSRRIGLDLAGQPLELKYGGKVSGRAGRFELGALSIRQDESLGVDAATLSVVRAKAGIGEESTIGTVMTSGDPLSNTSNTLGGVDFLYRNSRMPGGRTLEAGGWYQQSDTDGFEDEDRAAGFGISIPSNVKFRGGFAVKQFEENFYPALGFVSRTGVRDTSGHVAYTHRPADGYWQSVYFGLEGARIEDLDGGALQSESWALTPFQLTNRTGDTVFWRSNFDKEVLPVDFQLLPGIVIPAGEYSFADHGVEVGFANHRKVAGRIAYIDGDFYTGTSDRLFGNFTWQPSPKFRTYVGYNINKIALPQGNFTTRIISTSFDVIFNSRLSWVNLIQYDNVSETMGINIRVHFIPEAGRELFFVINHGLQDFDRDNRFRSQVSDVVAKLSYTFRF
jgi:hypothetical protein